MHKPSDDLMRMLRYYVGIALVVIVFSVGLRACIEGLQAGDFLKVLMSLWIMFVPIVIALFCGGEERP